MVFSLEDFDPSSINHILLSHCRPYQIWTRPMFWFDQEVLQSVLCLITLWVHFTVDTTSAVGVNKAQIVGTHDGRVIVPVYDWVSFLGQYFKKLPGIKKFHHFTLSKKSPGRVSYKESVFILHSNHSCFWGILSSPHLQLFLQLLSLMDSLKKGKHTYTEKYDLFANLELKTLWLWHHEVLLAPFLV